MALREITDADLAEEAPATEAAAGPRLRRISYDDLAAPVVDMGPEARRARSLAPPAGGTVDPSPSGPIMNRAAFGLRDPDTGDPIFPGPQDVGGAPAVWTNNPEEAGDVMVQTGLLGHGAGTVASTALRAFGAPAAVQAIGAGAASGAAATGTAGGDPLLGAVLGGAFPAAAGAARGLARVAGRPNPVRDIGQGATKAPKRLREDVKFKAEQGNLAEVMGELPAARKAILTDARTNPGKAATTIDKVVSEATDGNSADFAAIQRQQGGVPLDPITARLEGLEGRLNQQGRGVAADAVGRIRADLIKRYGAEPGAKLSAQQIRNMRNDMGSVADPARTIKPNTKRQALAKVHEIFNKEIEDVAAETRGVDVEAMRKRNRQISTLIPVRDALRARAESESELSLGRRLKNVPGNAFRRGVRELDYALRDVPDLAPVIPISAPERK
jgi:hypothetical protein